MSGGTTIMTLSDLSRVFVLASVDESDVGKVELEQPAIINADAFPEKDFKGKVIRIATKGVNISNVVTFEVKLEVMGEEKYLLKPEMSANVKIITAEEDDVLLIPIDAVLRRQGKQYVEVVNSDGNIVDRLIETGIDNGEKIHVISGLEKGEEIKLHKEDAESRWSNPPRKRTLGRGRRTRRK